VPHRLAGAGFTRAGGYCEKNGLIHALALPPRLMARKHLINAL
jgi:hypothetical protein